MCDYEVNDYYGIWGRMSFVIREYTVLQIAKINDPAEFKNGDNLSLEYFVNYYAPTKSLRKKYEKFRSENRNFIEAIRTARHKAITHSDLDTLKAGGPVGAFPKGEDKTYFDSLHKIISEVLNHQNLGPFADWPDFIIDDTKEFMKKLQISAQPFIPADV